MVIEDDGAIRDELALILENEGYETVLVTDFEDVPISERKHRRRSLSSQAGIPQWTS